MNISWTNLNVSSLTNISVLFMWNICFVPGIEFFFSLTRKRERESGRVKIWIFHFQSYMETELFYKQLCFDSRACKKIFHTDIFMLPTWWLVFDVCFRCTVTGTGTGTRKPMDFYVRTFKFIADARLEGNHLTR